MLNCITFIDICILVFINIFLTSGIDCICRQSIASCQPPVHQGLYNIIKTIRVTVINICNDLAI